MKLPRTMSFVPRCHVLNVIKIIDKLLSRGLEATSQWDFQRSLPTKPCAGKMSSVMYVLPVCTVVLSVCLGRQKIQALCKKDAPSMDCSLTHPTVSDCVKMIRNYSFGGESTQSCWQQCESW